VLGKAVIIEEQRLAIADMHRDVPFLPMAGDEQDRTRTRRQAFDQPREIGLHRLPHRSGRAAGGIHEEAGTTAMRHEKRG